MITTVDINKVLVVLSPDLIQPANPGESPLIQRAVALAKAAGCELELFHASYDSMIDYKIIASNDERQRQREAITDRDATLLADIAARLSMDGVNVSYEARWDYPRTDAILRKISRSNPDMVMKQSREHSFLLGMSSNTDWDLARRSPVHVWFVNDKTDEVRSIVAAVGNHLGTATKVTSAADYDVFDAAGVIAEEFDAKIFPVNAYHIAGSHSFYVGAGGMVPVVQPVNVDKDLRGVQLERHRSAVNALAQYFQIDTDNVYVREGYPSEVITKVAAEVDADMIVMGARSISRLERMIRSVTVELVMADAKCDVLIVRDDDDQMAASAATETVCGVPKYNLEKAILNPQAAFRSPLDVTGLHDISVELRQRILQAWEYDIRAGLAAENEGGAAGDVDANALDEIRKAKKLLDGNPGEMCSGQMSLSIAAR